MSTPDISLEIFEGELKVFVKEYNFKVLNSTCVNVIANIYRSQEKPQGGRQEHPQW